MTFLADDYVVMHGNAENPASLNYRFGHDHISLRRRWIAAWMIVGKDHGARA
jgi:hypothetical protein